MGNEWMDKKISEYTEKMAGTFLFWAPKTGKAAKDTKSPSSDEDNDAYSAFMDMRTRVLNLDLMRSLTYYGTMSDAYQLKSARDGKNLIERLLIGFEGRGRQEAVDVLRQQFAKKVEVETGGERDLE